MKYVTSPIFGVLYNLLWSFIINYNVAYHVNTGITTIRVKCQVQPDNKLHARVVRNPPCRLNSASSSVYVIYWEKLEVSGRDSVGGAIVNFCEETEKNHKFPRHLLYFVSMSRINPVTQKFTTLGLHTCFSISRMHSKLCAIRNFSGACAACTRQEVCYWSWMLHFWLINFNV